MRNPFIFFLLISVAVAATADGLTHTITFDESPDLVHGRIIDNQFIASHGLSIEAENRNIDLAAIFDSRFTGPTSDPDLLGPTWADGNLPSDTALGNLLILAENSHGAADGILDNPDDEGRRPAGSLLLTFDDPALSLGFDLIDVEGPEEFGDDSGFFAAFLQGDTEIGRVGFGSLVDRDGAVFGNNTANRISPITLSELAAPGSGFDRVRIHLGGSAAIDNLTWTTPDPPVSTEDEDEITAVPEPSVVGLVGLSLAAAGLSVLRRPRSRRR